MTYFLCTLIIASCVYGLSKLKKLVGNVKYVNSIMIIVILFSACMSGVYSSQYAKSGVASIKEHSVKITNLPWGTAVKKLNHAMFGKD